MKKRTTFILVALMVVAMVLGACGGGNTDSGNKQTTDEGDVLRVGMECGYPPFNWTQVDDSNGGVAIEGGNYAGGYDVEIAKLIAEGLGKELVIVKTAWDGLTPAVQSDTIDVIMAGMSPTAERRETIDFSDYYYHSDLVMVVKKGGPFENAKSLEDFKDAKVTGQLNTFHYSVVDQIPGVVKEQAMEDFPAMRVALQSGMIDAYVSERPEGISATAANDDFAMVIFDEGKGFEYTADDSSISVGIKKGNDELREKINEILKTIPEEKRQEIMEAAIKNQPSEQK